MPVFSFSNNIWICTLMFQDDFKEWLHLLTEKKVEYLLVGGYAVALHGIPRTTGDMDIWINNTQKNVEIVLECLKEFGFSSINLEVADLLKPYAIVQLGYPPVRIDIITDIDGIDFNTAYRNRIILNQDGVSISLISLNDLILNKKSSGRDIDNVDVKKLIQLEKRKNI